MNISERSWKDWTSRYCSRCKSINCIFTLDVKSGIIRRECLDCGFILKTQAEESDTVGIISVIARRESAGVKS